MIPLLKKMPVQFGDSVAICNFLPLLGYIVVARIDKIKEWAGKKGNRGMNGSRPPH